MIDVRDVSFAYDVGGAPLRAIRNLSLTVKEGEYLSVIGTNGSGKTTLAKTLNALLLPDAGVVKVDGIDTQDEDRLWEIRQRVGMVFQNPDNQIVGTTVVEDVAFGPENLGLPSAEIRQRVDAALTAVGIEALRDRQPHTLSGGQKQLVAIAGAIAMRPKYLVLDEPTSMLDPRGRDEVLTTVRLLQEQGLGIFAVTNFMEEAALGDRIAVLHQGTVVIEGSPRQVFRRVDLLRELYLDVPAVTELACELRAEGLPISEDLLRVEEMVEALWRILN